MFVKMLYIALVLFVMLGCSDDADVVIYKEGKSLEKPLKCMRLVVFPPDEQIQKVANANYKFTKDCAYKVVIQKKGGIVCNSTHNTQQKTLSNFPSGYIRLDLYKGREPLYSYYKDLTTKVSDEDIERGLKRLLKDMF